MLKIIYTCFERMGTSYHSISLFSPSTHAIHSISTDPHRVQSPPLDAIGDKRSQNDSRSHNCPRLERTSLIARQRFSYGFIALSSNCTELQRSLHETMEITTI